MEVTVTQKGNGRYFEGVGVRHTGEVIDCKESTADQWSRQGWVTKGRSKSAKKAKGDQDGAE